VSFQQLERLSRRILASFPAVANHEQTHDVLNEGCIRLAEALRKTTPTSKLHFFRLAAMQIRFTLIDLKRHYYGPRGYGANVIAQGRLGSDTSQIGSCVTPSCQTMDPARLAEWTDFHRAVEKLPEQLRVLFDLLHYSDMSQREAAELLGVSENTIQTRWQRARMQIARQVPPPTV
ncbi:MAG: sigma-70 family RNA polymerase sigma factor, partial [Planctomycetaceae bacterium]